MTSILVSIGFIVSLTHCTLVLSPGTNERVCLISGSVEGIMRIHEFIMEKIKEKPDPNAKMAIDFDHKQPAEREKQVSHFDWLASEVDKLYY